MASLLFGPSFYYQDVNLIAQPQKLITSRSQISKELHRIIVAPMAAVVGETFASKALSLGLTVCLPRFSSLEDRIKVLESLGNPQSKLYFSVGLNEWDAIRKLKEVGHNYILVDVANGYLQSVVDFVEKLQADFFNVMVGNVHSRAGMHLYKYARIRCGIGCGGACGTSNMTGYNRGQITELLECAATKHFSNQNILIADGGIAEPGYAVKAFGAGADYVMMGGMFALAEEAQNVIDGEYKYWGGASHAQQLKHKGAITKHSEGKVLNLNEERVVPLEDIVNDLWGGIASGVSYSGYRSLTDFIGNGVFESKK
jgi:GMP reductase